MSKKLDRVVAFRAFIFGGSIDKNPKGGRYSRR